MTPAKSGDTVRVHYTGRLDDGTVFDSSDGRDPLEFTLGEGNVIPGFEAAVVGMSVGETRSRRIEPEDAYGPRQDGLKAAVPRTAFPEGMELAPGVPLQVQAADGRVLDVVVDKVGEQEVVLDANHPLAGQALTFEITLAEIVADA